MVMKMILQGIVFSLLSLIILFLLTKLMGYRQVTQLSMYDYVIGISIGSIAAEILFLDTYDQLLKPIVGMVVYCLFTIFLSYITRHSFFARQIIEGNPILLYKNDMIITKNLNKAKMDINEFLMQLRTLGYFDLTQLDTIILETNGKLSVFIKTKYRPMIVNDTNINIKKEQMVISLIIDGHILKKHLSLIHKNEDWLKKQLQIKGYHQYKDLLLVLYQDNKIIIYKKDC